MSQGLPGASIREVPVPGASIGRREPQGLPTGQLDANRIPGPDAAPYHSASIVIPVGGRARGFFRRMIRYSRSPGMYNLATANHL